jgi:cytochrome c oxidase assembly protein subunit 15
LSSVALADVARPAVNTDRSIGRWLLLCCGMIFLMVVIGGITRLTESGLSITEWQPVSGVLPPLGAAQWQADFEKYQAIPQYRAVHPDMTLAEFKLIFFWEYLHRLWGRLIGLVFGGPFLYFLARRRISRQLAPRLAGLFVLGGLQGALGWYMVESGLSQRIEVSQYRLAAHLLAAVVIYAAMLWVALDLLPARVEASGDPRRHRLRRGVGAAIGLVVLTLLAGAFVAGLRAGYIYNTFPLMAGGLAPAEYWSLTPWYLNWFENPAAAQFNHRALAETTWVVVTTLWLHGLRLDLPRGLRVALHAFFAAASLQAALGIATLLLGVPMPLAVAHQAGAMLLLTAAVVARHRLGPERVPKISTMGR